MFKLERLNENDYAEVLYVLNASFDTVDPGADFEKKLPIMWTREHDYMSKHFGVREDGKIVALLGVYPLPVNVGGQELLFATVGNVATLPEARGKGYMKMLMDEALKEVERLGIDCARLGGLRSRYNRFGFDHAGVSYTFKLTRRNVSENPPKQAFTFRLIGRDDTEGVAFARSCQQRSGIHAIRKTHTDFYMSTRAWEHQPYLALNADGQPVGYLAVSQDNASIAEQGVAPGVSMIDMLAAWLAQTGVSELTFRLAPYEVENVQGAFSCCESWSMSSPSMFWVIHWDRVVEALMNLSLSVKTLPEGTASVGIEGWGTLEMTIKDGKATARRTDAPAQVTLPHRTATQMLFGPLNPGCMAQLPALLSAWLPLPLSWNGQDRV